MKAVAKLDLEKLIFIDIETVPQTKELDIDSEMFDSFSYGSRGEGKTNDEILALWPKDGSLNAEFGKIVCISVGRFSEGEFNLRSYYNHDEKVLLGAFNSDLKAVQASLGRITLCGHAVKGFDVPFIFKRLMINGIPPCSILDVAGLKSWEVDFVDTKELWKGSGFTSSSLVHITTAFNLPSPKGIMNGSKVYETYYSDDKDRLEKIAQYCCEDVIAPARILLKWRFDDSELKIVYSDKKVEKVPTLIALFNGADLDDSKFEEIVEKIKLLDEQEQEAAFKILEAVAVSETSTFDRDDLETIKEVIQ